MEKLMELFESSRCANGGRERRALVCFLKPLGKKREPLWRVGRDINTPCLPTVT
jgi:hypothetical protein